jgi:hypothetical protein
MKINQQYLMMNCGVAAMTDWPQPYPFAAETQARRESPLAGLWTGATLRPGAFSLHPPSPYFE